MLRKVLIFLLAGSAGLMPTAQAAPRTPAPACVPAAGVSEVACSSGVIGLPITNPTGPEGNGYTPSDIASIYHLKGGRPGLVTILATAQSLPAAVIDHDITTYRAAFHLPPCTLASGCLQVHDLQATDPTTVEVAAETNTDLEIELDLEGASAACPGCRLQLVRGGEGRSAAGKCDWFSRFHKKSGRRSELHSGGRWTPVD